MASLANAIQTIAQSNQNERTIIVGTVLAAPAAFGDQIMVVTDYAPLSPIGPMDFGASQGNTLPAAGDACVVVYDDDHKPYCVWFDDVYSGEPSGSAGGDLSGTYPNPTVAKVNGVTVPLTTSAWVAPTLINSWANFGSGFETAAYLKDPFGFVHLKGALHTGTTGTVAFVLPSGYRPGATAFPSAAGAGPSAASVQITTAGNVSCFYTSAPIGLSGITFLAEN